MSLLRQLLTSPSMSAALATDAYRKSHEMEGSTEGAQENYHVPIKVHYAEVGYFAENGIADPLYFQNYPSAVYYNGKTYVVWQGDAGYDPYIICYDHATDTWSDAVKVGTNPLSADNHGGPIVIVDNSGYIHVFFGSHNSTQKHSKSDNPEDITAWTAQADPTADSTYPHVHSDNGSIHFLYWKNDVGRTYRLSNDNGASWGAEHILVSTIEAVDNIYSSMSQVHGTKIHLVWRYAADIGEPRNVYHAYLETADGKMYGMDGTDLGTTITKAEADASCIVVDSGVYETFHMALQIDGDGYPYIMYNIETTVDSAWAIKFTRWNGSEWVAPDTITVADEPLNNMDFIVHSATSITAFVVTSGEAGRGGDITKWTWNGESWTEVLTILSEAEAGKPLLNPKVVVNYDDELKLVFSEYGVIGTEDLKVYASDGDSLVGPPEVDSGENVYCHEKCKTDFGDIRFRQGETELEHWLEEKVDSDYALFWVKVPNIPADPDTATIHVYYGKDDATSASTESREDFTTFTEVEENDDIQKTEYHVDFADRRDRTTYLYKDYTALSEFAWHLNLKRVTHADSSWLAQILMANVLGNQRALRDNDDEHIHFAVSGTEHKINMYEWDSAGNPYTSTPELTDPLTLGTMYYASLRKYGTALVLDIYTTAEKRLAGGDGDFGHLTITLTVDYSFQYGYIGDSYDIGSAEAGSSDFEDLFIRKYVSPEPANGDWGSEEAIVWPF